MTVYWEKAEIVAKKCAGSKFAAFHQLIKTDHSTFTTFSNNKCKITIVSLRHSNQKFSLVCTREKVTFTAIFVSYHFEDLKNIYIYIYILIAKTWPTRELISLIHGKINIYYYLTEA